MLSEVPASVRKGLMSTSILLFGFTFFTTTMFAGGKIGMAFDFKTLIWACIAGNLLLGLYAAVLGYIASHSGLNSVLMGRFCTENWFNSFKNERYHRLRYATHADMKATSFEYIEVFYNRKRQHSTLGYRSPIQYLEQWTAKQNQEKRAA